MGFLSRLATLGRKNLREMHHGGDGAVRWLGGVTGGMLSDTIAGDSFDYAKRVGDGIDSSVVMAPIQWIQRALPESPLQVDVQRGEEWEPTPDHPLARLLESPNNFYSGTQLLQATIYSLLTAGNAYWIVVRNQLRQPIQLWYAPHWLVDPRRQPGSPDTEFLTHFEYRPGGRKYDLEPEDVVHFREGINPRDPRLGLSPLHAAIREIYMDMESTTFQVALLRNNAIMGAVISNASNIPMTPVDVENIKQYVRQQFSGERRGGAMVLSHQTKVDRVSWSPKEMDLSPARDVAEERVCAAIGLPAAVVGFGSGLEQTKVGATMNELRRLAWTNAIIPRQRNIAQEIGRALLPAFTRGRQTERLRVRFDHSEVAALQEERDRLFRRADMGVRGGWLMVDQAKRMIGITPEDSDKVYLRGFNLMEQAPGAEPAVPPGEGEKTARWPERKEAHQETPLEQLVQARAQRATATPVQRQFAEDLARREAILADRFAGLLERFFVRELGGRIARAAESIMPGEAGKQAPIDPHDAMIAERIMEATGMADLLPIYRAMHEAIYLEIAQDTAQAFAGLGLATDLPDPVARSIVATGGRRAGLIDLDAQTRRALFDALTEGRALGEGAAQLAQRIRAQIPAGPWSSSEVRARVIARTETRYAQNVSTVEMGRAMGVERYMIFDGRIATSDEFCISLNGAIVSHQEALGLLDAEHPNGTRSFSPHFE